ncbi:hypothetical protein KCU73_g9493, partial [Aureobasidium melanogenum]
MEPPQGDRDLSLPGMPAEILSLIINLVDSESLKTLRLTSKRLCAISSGPFANRHFSERKHVASAYSMEALVKITAHPFFGKFVKTVIISGSRPEVRENPLLEGVPRSCVQCPGHILLCQNPAPHHLAMGFEQLRVKLEEAFSNIRQHSSSVSIGACDTAYSISGQLKALADRVAQMELDKIAEIERDGYVRTDIVGVSKTSQSEEDVIEHGSMEDDGSDEADNERGEREENDDQDGHEHTVELSEI